MQPATVTPRNSPFPGSKIFITAWIVENVGMLVELVNPEWSPYLGDALWSELSLGDDSPLYHRLNEQYGIDYSMTSSKTGRLWEDYYYIFGTEPVLVSIYDISTTLGLFTNIRDTGSDTYLCALNDMRSWLQSEVNNPRGLIYETPIHWINLHNHSEAPQKLGFLVSPVDTKKCITLCYGEVYPYWGDVNSNILALYVDLTEISTELAELLNYTIQTTNR